MRIEKSENSQIIPRVIHIFIFSFLLLLALLFSTDLTAKVINMKEKNLYGSDYISYFVAAKIIKDGRGINLYDLQTEKEYYQKLTSIGNFSGQVIFRNVPASVFLYIPFVKFGLVESYKFFFFVNVFLLAFSVFLIVRYLRLNGYIKVFIIAFLWLPVYIALLQGQITFLFLLFLSLVYILFKKNMFFLSGFFSSLLLIKPQYFFIIPLLLILVDKKKTFVAGFLISLFFLFTTCVYVTGIRGLLNYPGYILSTENPLYTSRSEDFMSLGSLILKIFPNLTFVGITIVLEIFGLFALFMYYRNLQKGRPDKDILFVVAVIFMIILSPHSLLHDMSFLILPIFIILKRIEARKSLGSFFLISMLLFQFIGFSRYIFLIPLILTIVAIVYLIANSKQNVRFFI